MRARSASRSAAKPFSAARRLRLVLERSREQRWRQAADRMDCALETWIVETIDEATAVLDARCDDAF
jgi:hypothetical protein